jgi:hypothetical protein
MPDGTDAGVGRVLVISEEDRPSDQKARLLAAGANLENVHFGSDVDATTETHFFTLPNDADALAAEIRRVGYRLVIFDALLSHLDAKLNAYKPQDARAALRPLVEIARETGAAIVCIRHWTKASGRAAARGLGSSDFRNMVRSVLTFGPHPSINGLYVIALSKSNLAKSRKSLSYELVNTSVDDVGETPRVEWRGPVEVSADELAASDLPGAVRVTNVGAAVAFLQSLLSTGPMESKDVYKMGSATGFSRSAIDRASRTVGIRKIDQSSFPRTTIWQLLQSNRILDADATDATDTTIPESNEQGVGELIL